MTKGKYLILPPLPPTINGVSLKKVSSQRILGIIKGSNLSFSPHIENIANKYKRLYNRLTLFPDIPPDVAIQIFKSFIRSKLEYGSIIWVHTIHKIKHLRILSIIWVHTIHKIKHLRILGAAQKRALMVIPRTMKFIPLEIMKAQLCIAPIDLSLQELQRTEGIKLFQKSDTYTSNNMEKSYRK